LFKSRNVATTPARFLFLIIALTTADSFFFSPVARGADVTFIHIGFLPGDDSSQVRSVNDAVTLAACASFYIQNTNPPRVFNYAARWTPSDGLQPLPRLPNNSFAGDPYGRFITGTDITADGTRIAFIAPTEDQSGVAAGISDPDGNNLIALTSLPNGELMTEVNQLSDDGQTAFGYRLVNFSFEGAIWTSADGIRALVPPAGFTEVFPISRAISADGSISAGTLFQLDQNSNITAEEAYRWTSAGGIAALGYLPGATNSSAIAMSAEGSFILGTSGSSFFLWQEGEGMSGLSSPQTPTGFYSFLGSGGLSADGAVAVVTYEDISSGTAAPDISYIYTPATGFYFDLQNILLEAGAGADIEGWSSFHCFGITDDGNTVFGYAGNPDGTQEGFIATFSKDYLRNLEIPLPVITSPLTAEAFFEEPFSYHITASEMPFDFAATGLPAGLEFSLAKEVPGGPLFGDIFGQPTETGFFSVTISATNLSGTTSAVLQLTVSPSANIPRLLNLSTRGNVLTGDNVLIGGFIIPSGQPKEVILRAIGPSLPGVTNPLVDPVLSLYQPDGTVVINDNWKDSQLAEIEATGLAPKEDREAAIVATLNPGAYTAIVSGKDGGMGVGLFEVYDLDVAAGSKLANISTRGLVDTGEDVLIGGIIANDYLTYIVVRAIGPSLADASIPNPLMDPMLELYNANGVLTGSNDDWQDTALADQIQAFGLAPIDERESAIFTSLFTEPITAIVRGKDGSPGVGLVEVYNVEYNP
jgi:hypothetical protein